MKERNSEGKEGGKCLGHFVEGYDPELENVPGTGEQIAKELLELFPEGERAEAAKKMVIFNS